MKHPRIFSLVAATALLLSCGQKSVITSASVPGTPGSSTPVLSTPRLGVAPHDVVIRLGVQGFYGSQAMVWRNTAELTILADGTVFQPGAQVEIFPGPLVPPVQVGKISEAEVDRLLAAAESAQMFRTVVYTSVGAADAGDTVLTISAKQWLSSQGQSRTAEHRANALGTLSETNPDRKALLDFVNKLRAVAVAPAGAADISKFVIEAVPAPSPTAGAAQPGEKVAWPASIGVRLYSARTCAVVEGQAATDLFRAANQNTVFTDDTTDYVLFVRPFLPGDPGCTNT